MPVPGGGWGGVGAQLLGWIMDGIILRHTDMTCDLDLLNILEAKHIFQFVIPRCVSS